MTIRQYVFDMSEIAEIHAKSGTNIWLLSCTGCSAPGTVAQLICVTIHHTV